MTYSSNPSDSCDGCKHKRGWECLRFPPAVIQQTQVSTPWIPTQWGFPPSGTKCGEFEEVKEP